uniref:Uncharacterized protein n=1 Tax=Steinernema glaseri TaxID=37863 RepID=A0A1I7Y781_9BILA
MPKNVGERTQDETTNKWEHVTDEFALALFAILYNPPTLCAVLPFKALLCPAGVTFPVLCFHCALRREGITLRASAMIHMSS